MRKNEQVELFRSVRVEELDPRRAHGQVPVWYILLATFYAIVTSGSALPYPKR